MTGMIDQKRLITTDEMVAALRDYPDADFSKHVLSLHERSNRLLARMAHYCDIAVAEMGRAQTSAGALRAELTRLRGAALTLTDAMAAFYAPGATNEAELGVAMDAAADQLRAVLAETELT